MDVTVSGQQLNVGNALTNYATERTNEVVNRYFQTSISAKVVFSKVANYLYHCEIIVNEGSKRNIVIKSSANSDEVYSSFDSALMKIEKQLRRYKSKIQDKDKASVNEILKSIDAKKYVLSPNLDESEEEGAPAIIAEKNTEIFTLSVGEAVMRMDLQNLPALMFKNSQSGRLNAVYYRKDGNISWVDCPE